MLDDDEDEEEEVTASDLLVWPRPFALRLLLREYLWLTDCWEREAGAGISATTLTTSPPVEVDDDEEEKEDDVVGMPEDC